VWEQIDGIQRRAYIGWGRGGGHIKKKGKTRDSTSKDSAPPANKKGLIRPLGDQERKKKEKRKKKKDRSSPARRPLSGKRKGNTDHDSLKVPYMTSLRKGKGESGLERPGGKRGSIYGMTTKDDLSRLQARDKKKEEKKEEGGRGKKDLFSTSYSQTFQLGGGKGKGGGEERKKTRPQECHRAVPMAEAPAEAEGRKKKGGKCGGVRKASPFLLRPSEGKEIKTRNLGGWRRTPGRGSPCPK